MQPADSTACQEWKEWRGELEADMYAEWEGYLPGIADAASKM